MIDSFIECEISFDPDRDCQSNWKQLVLPVYVQNLMLSPKAQTNGPIPNKLNNLNAPSTIFGEDIESGKEVNL